ncbi:hypothetical protein QQ008_06010 [Fulvivirgaceae bacterium BMA10]|uniref:PH domain-containing protein n=1 Tax=Splendidivirga corallicola TaxID=3051826 RepID=A0ABT8KKZ5_9BACT|nr:hypothetical protein [Fulvivirgaceae bacterium BMA10]
MSRVLFSEKQKFTQAWLIGIMILVDLLFLSIVVPKTLGQTDSGNDPVIMIFIILPVMFLVNYLIFSAKLETEIKDGTFNYRFFPFIRSWRSIHRSEIAQYEVRQFSPLRDFGGYGYRIDFTGKGRIFNVKGRSGLKLIFSNGRKILFGTQMPKELKIAMDKMMAKNEY